MTAPDGHIYSLGCMQEGAVPSANPLEIRKDWLDKLDMPVPTTLDEYLEVLRAFKTLDPGGVGADNVRPLGTYSAPSAKLYTTAFDLLLTALGYRSAPSNYNQAGIYPALRNGEPTIPANDIEQFDYWVAYLHTLYAEGLVDENVFTTLESAELNQQVQAGYIGSFGGGGVTA